MKIDMLRGDSSSDRQVLVARLMDHTMPQGRISALEDIYKSGGLEAVYNLLNLAAERKLPDLNESAQREVLPDELSGKQSTVIVRDIKKRPSFEQNPSLYMMGNSYAYILQTQAEFKDKGVTLTDLRVTHYGRDGWGIWQSGGSYRWTPAQYLEYFGIEIPDPETPLELKLQGAKEYAFITWMPDVYKDPKLTGENGIRVTASQLSGKPFVFNAFQSRFDLWQTEESKLYNHHAEDILHVFDRCMVIDGKYQRPFFNPSP